MTPTDLLPVPVVDGELVEVERPLLDLRDGPLPEEAEHALALVLSHLFGGRSANHAAGLARLLRRYAHTAVKLDDGTRLPAPLPAIALDGCYPDGRYVLARRDGETTQSLRDFWRRHALEDGGEPLPLDLLRELLPPELWRVLLWFIGEGPTVAAARVELALLIEAEQEPRRRDRRHHEESLTSDSQLRSMGAAVKALMDTLVELTLRSALLGEALGAWQRTPAFRVPLRGEASTDTTAPSRAEVRLLWKRITDDLARRLPAAGELGEVEAIRRLSPNQLRVGGHFNLLRNRVLLVLLAVVGSRVGAIPRLRRSDFVRDHRRPDGSVGPALALRPGKRKRLTKVHWKPLPEGATLVIEAYLAYMECHLGGFAGDGPLLHAVRHRDTPWGKSSIAEYVNGISGKRPKPALLPRGADRCVGFTCHTFRSWAAQTVRSLDAHALLVRWHIDAAQHWIAEALLDHELGGMDTLYGGASKDPDREHLSGIGARLNWELLTGEAGARRVPDAASFRHGLHAELALNAELDQLGRDVDRAFQAPAPEGEDRVEQLLGRIEQLMHAHALVRRERQAYEELLAVERELERLRHDPDREVLLPDDAPAELANVDLAAIETEVRAGATAGPGGRRPVAAREWVSVQELRELAGVGGATVPRWLGQGGRPPQLPFLDGDPRNPWPAERVPVDDSLGQRHRRIIVAGISETFLMFAPGRLERLEGILATPGPVGWRREHCEAPLVKPTWLP